MANPSFEVASRLISPEIVVRTREYLEHEDTTPMHVDLDLTSDCNYRCRHCGDLARGLLNHGGLSWEILEPLLDDLRSLHVHEVVLIGGGEPTLSPHFAKTLQGLHQRGIHAGVVTNGSRLPSDVLDAMALYCAWVRISLDAGTLATYARVHNPMHGETFDSIIENMSRMIARMKGRVGVAYLVTPLNAHEIAATAALVKRLGASYIRIRPMQHPITGVALATPRRADVSHEILRARTLADSTFDVSVGDTNVAQPKRYSRCHAQAFGTTIAGDGNVYVCSKWRGEPWARIGNVRHERLVQIWRGPRRREVLQGLDPQNQCTHIHCGAHPLNQLLAAALDETGDTSEPVASSITRGR